MSVRSANNPALQSRVQQWAQQQGIEKPVHDLSLGQMQKASRSLGVDLGEVIALREELVGKAGDAAQTAGAKFKTTSDASQGAAMGFGGANVMQSALGTRFGGKIGAGKTQGNPDSDLAMSAMQGSRFANKVDVKQPYVEFKGYRGGSDDVDLFFKSNYSFSDVDQALKSFDFLMDTFEAKEYIGLKIANGTESILSEVGITTSQFDSHEMRDAFDSSDYTVRDARRALGEFPFLNSVTDAMEYIGLKVMNGNESILADVGIRADSRLGNDDLFFKAGYTYDDALAAMNSFDFLSSVGEAKNYIGLKVSNDYEVMLREVGITPGNFDSHEMRGAYLTSGYNYSDAEKAMESFGFLNSVEDAKEYIGLKVINGTEEILAEIGVTTSPYDSHEMMDAFRHSGYSETDARAALMAFDFLDSVQDAKEYIGLKIVNGYESMLADVGITRQQWDSHECIAAYAKAGYTNADCDLAAEGWSFLDGRNDAREYIGLKVLNGAEHILAEVGITPRDVNNVYDYKAKGDGYWDKGVVAWDAKGKDYDSYDTGYKGGVGYVNDWDYKK